MKYEIKQRIETIKNGEIPNGYKKGKLGIVPKDWEEVPFSTLFTSTSDYTDDLEKYPLYSLTIEDGITAKTDRYNRTHLVKKENSYKIVRPNDYAYNPMNIRFGAVARHKGESPVAVSGYYDIFTTVHPSDLTFMDNFLTYGAMIIYYNRVSTGSLIEKQRVHFSDFLKFSLPLPPLEERKKIANILSAQDKVIECYEKKIEQLKRMKKYYLQNMFPKHGETVPKIRFNGFTEPWKQRKLGKYIIEYTEVTTENNQYPALTSSRKGIFLQKEYFSGNQIASADNKGYNIVPYGYFTYRHMSDDEIFYFNINDIVENGIVSTLYPVFTTAKDLDSRYLQYQLNYGSEFSKFAILQKQGGSRTYMYLSKLKRLKLTMPVSVGEQKHISKFFMKLDNLITLHQRKLEEEKKKKKALQQLLLTGIVRT